MVRKCSELQSVDMSNGVGISRDTVSSLVLTGDTEMSCFEDMVWFSVSCRCVCVYARERDACMRERETRV